MAAPQNFVSVSRRPPDVEDYIDILRRYRSWVIGPTFAGLVVSVVVAFFWPDMYLCTAAMQIKPGSVSSTLMPTAVTSQMTERISELSREILGRDNLITLIQDPKLDLYKKERQRYSVEDVAEDTFRKHVRIVPYDTTTSANGAQAFRILFEYPDKYKARALVVRLITDFTNKNTILQTNNTNSASTLFGDMVRDAKEKMEAKEQELAAFAAENQGRLPDNFGPNMLEVQTRQNSIANINQQIAQEHEKQALLESNLNNNKNQQSQVEANLTQTIVAPNQAVKDSKLVQLEGQLTAKRGDCIALLRRFQPEYPDVLACNDQLKAMEEQKAAIEKADAGAVQPGTTSRTVPNSAAAQQLSNLKSEENNIRGQITASAMAVQVRERQLAEMTRQLKEAQDRINASPQVIQKFNQLTADLQMAKEEYKDASTKKQQAGNEQQMEEHRAGETLDILEQPITPEKPVSPIRGAIIGIGTVIGLVVGVALAGAKEVKNTSLKNLKDVRAYTNLPVLSSIPLLENALLVRRKRRLAWLAWSSALIVGTILMSGSVYYYLVIVPQA